MLRGISASTRAPVGFDRAQQLIDDEVARLLDAEAEDGALRMQLSAARVLGEPDLALPVQVQVGPARELRGAFTRDVRWWPMAGEHALSHFDGALRLRGIGEECLVELIGHYLVPVSLAGVFGGGLAGHRSARRSLGVLVEHIADRMVAAATLAG